MSRQLSALSAVSRMDNTAKTRASAKGPNDAPISDLQLPTSEGVLPTSDPRPPTSNVPPPLSAFRFHALDSGLLTLESSAVRQPLTIMSPRVMFAVRTELGAHRPARTVAGTPAGCFWCAHTPRMVSRAPAGKCRMQSEECRMTEAVSSQPSAFSRTVSPQRHEEREGIEVCSDF